MKTPTPASPIMSSFSCTATTGKTHEKGMPLGAVTKKRSKYTVRLNILIKETQRKLCTLELP